jgi:hypothetical protein
VYDLSNLFKVHAMIIQKKEVVVNLQNLFRLATCPLSGGKKPGGEKFPIRTNGI